MTNTIAIYEQMNQLQTAAQALHASGFFKDTTSQAQAMVKVMAGAELGLPPFASMTGIGACAGVPLMVAGGMLWSASSGTSAIASFEQARIEGDSISSASFAAAKDIGMSTLAGVGGALFILALALDVMALFGSENPVATQAFLGALDSTHSSGGAGNKRKHQNNIDSS